MQTAVAHFSLLQFANSNLFEPIGIRSLDFPYVVHLICFSVKLLMMGAFDLFPSRG